MKYLLVFLLCLTLIGCAMETEVLLPDVYPRLQNYNSIYYPGTDLAVKEITVRALLSITDHGDVVKVDLPKSSGSAALDDTIKNSVYRWKYSPAEYKGKPISILISQKIMIQFQQPVSYDLAEIVVARVSLADSIIQQLRLGKDFDILAKEYSTAESSKIGGMIGKINLNDLSQELFTPVSQLVPGAWTDPLPVKDQYVIYKRLK